MIELLLKNQSIVLHPFKGVYRKENATLLLADLHLGKAVHFRKKGIPVPTEVQDNNWDRLTSLLLDFRPKKTLFLGDLFHSDYNKACDDFSFICQQFSHINFELIVGNHDILGVDYYRSLGITTHQEGHQIGPFSFTHHPLPDDGTESPTYNFCGHIHPSVRLRGNANQTLKLPCFYFGNHQSILPAFGSFTGTSCILPQKGDQVFVITDDQIIPV